MEGFIDPDKVRGYKFPQGVYQYTRKDAILYALGIGFGSNPTHPEELKFLYEGNETGFCVFPTYSANFAFSFLPQINDIPGLRFEPMQLLHGEHRIEFHKSLPAEGEIKNKAEITGIFDKGSGAVLVIEVISELENGGILAVNQFKVFIRGLGGFGGERGPAAENFSIPERAPDFIHTDETLPQQALLYRLSGDRNPLHVDPKRAAVGGFDRPILHGLCSFGYASRAIAATVLGYDAGRIKSISCRFKNVVYPGGKLVTKIWQLNDDQILFQVHDNENDQIVLDNGIVELNN